MAVARVRFDLRGTPDPMRLVALLAAGGILIAFAWFTTRSRPSGSAAAECAGRYALARTEDDSARIDAETPETAGSGITSCGALRQAGRL